MSFVEAPLRCPSSVRGRELEPSKTGKIAGDFFECFAALSCSGLLGV